MAIGDTRPQARPEDTRGIFERISDDISMGFTAPFSDEQTRVDAMRDRGFTDTEISRHMAATANTIRENDRLAELESRRDGGGSSFRDRVEGASGFLGDDEEYTYNPNNAAAQYRQTLMNRFGAMPMQSGFVQPAPMPMQPSAPGPVPPQMAPYTNPSAPPGPTSPAFMYAAQNYDRLGGMQRMMPKPPEMMSVAERQQFYPDMYTPMPAPTPAPAPEPAPEPVGLGSLFGSWGDIIERLMSRRRSGSSPESDLVSAFTNASRQGTQPTTDPNTTLGRVQPYLQMYGGIAGLKSDF